MAKILCRVVRQGGSKAEVEAKYQSICGDGQRRRPGSGAEAALELAAQTILDNNAELDDAYTTFKIINALIDVVFQLIPFLRSIKILERFVQLFKYIDRANRVLQQFKGPNVIQAKMEVIQRQKAANDAVYNIVRQAAANEARFRKAANE